MENPKQKVFPCGLLFFYKMLVNMSHTQVLLLGTPGEIDALSVPVANVPHVKGLKKWFCPFSTQSP